MRLSQWPKHLRLNQLVWNSAAVHCHERFARAPRTSSASARAYQLLAGPLSPRTSTGESVWRSGFNSLRKALAWVLRQEIRDRPSKPMLI